MLQLLQLSSSLQRFLSVPLVVPLSCCWLSCARHTHVQHYFVHTYVFPDSKNVPNFSPHPTGTS